MGSIKNYINRKVHNRIVSKARNITSSSGYTATRMKQMSEEIVYWNTREHDHAKLTIEKEFCKKMQEIYLKRFIWYQNHYV